MFLQSAPRPTRGVSQLVQWAISQALYVHQGLEGQVGVAPGPAVPDPGMGPETAVESSSAILRNPGKTPRTVLRGIPPEFLPPTLLPNHNQSTQSKSHNPCLPLQASRGRRRRSAQGSTVGLCATRCGWSTTYRQRPCQPCRCLHQTNADGRCCCCCCDHSRWGCRSGRSNRR